MNRTARLISDTCVVTILCSVMSLLFFLLTFPALEGASASSNAGPIVFALGALFYCIALGVPSSIAIAELASHVRTNRLLRYVTLLLLCVGLSLAFHVAPASTAQGEAVLTSMSVVFASLGVLVPVVDHYAEK